MDFKSNKLSPTLYQTTLFNIKKINELNIKLKSVFYTCNLKDNPELETKCKNITFKLKNYIKWISLLENLDEECFSSIELIKEHISSKSLIKKIEEINNSKTHTLKEIDELEINIKTLNDTNTSNFIVKKENKNKSYNRVAKRMNTSKYNTTDLVNLQRVNGIGEKTAEKFLDMNINLEHFLEEWDTLFKLTNHQLVPDEFANLNSSVNIKHLSSHRQSYIENKFKHTKYLKYLHFSQLIGIKYLHDIEKRIPRTEINKIEKILKTLINKINSDIIMIVCGSYRRGNKDSGDIDILLTHKEIKEKDDIDKIDNNILLQIVISLQNIGFLWDHITVDGNSKYMGICKLNGNLPYRRLDIRFISYNSFAPALLYFTGSADLNKKMRTEALSKGYRLNEYGLYKTEYNKQTNKEEIGEQFYTPTEESIFKLLKMPYLEPTHRNIK